MGAPWKADHHAKERIGPYATNTITISCTQSKRSCTHKFWRMAVNPVEFQKARPLTLGLHSFKAFFCSQIYLQILETNFHPFFPVKKSGERSSWAPCVHPLKEASSCLKSRFHQDEGNPIIVYFSESVFSLLLMRLSWKLILNLP